jgi:succinyl-diaminopimelate desuccinylase
LFAGHTDVVPPGDSSAWRFDPFSAEIAEDMLWGRGAVDMKGGLAAAIAAVLAFLESGGLKTGSIAFLITGDEEGPAVNGTPKLLEWAHAQGERFDHCILGEPTNPDALGDMIKIGRRGSLSGVLNVEGKQGHVGYPHLADNPVHHILRLCAALKAKPLDAGAPHFDPSNLEITSIDVGNGAVNVIPSRAQAKFNIRFNDLWTPETLSAEVAARLAAAAGGARYALAFQPTNALAFLTEPGPFVDLFADAVEAETGRRPALSTTGGTSDARFICRYAQVVEFGLVGQTMHAVDERTPIADLHRLEAIYQRALGAYFA